MKTFTTILFLFLIQYTNAQFEDRFYYPSKKLKKIEIPHTEEFISVEKDSLHTIFFQPKKSAKATILFFHGAGGNISSYQFMIAPLVKNGYQVYAVDFRGYGKSTGNATHINVATDSEIVFSKMKEHKAIKNKKLIVYGASLGCQIATHLTNKHQKEIDALILDGGFSSFADIAKENAPEQVHNYIDNVLGKMYPSKEEIKSIINIPKLIIHSTEDTSIAIQHSKIVFKNATEPKVFFTSKKDHLLAITYETEAVLSKINSLFTIQE
ncbi:alpha/beta hydrolase [Polaribacter reichenbachii]|uniref:Serine aminopeptidase S33 domain-containing protein n=1 Tax=Polaribacter reichenbachii TaxID=996801 RepID=A0A1B8U4V1_9FLAO|nr:alpha/beta hydrolase [Polaribacter reichenbachii]APZ44892.1 alpha/beta hydrolase [Polaribacter reichenbachii]AUC18756.1 alpha/beta hydrolase [Polaribacter reichenbachii]OBY66871.1 hypothetical protein LPB301_05440 [Polaribacter reichenbachii]